MYMYFACNVRSLEGEISKDIQFMHKIIVKIAITAQVNDIAL